MKKLMSILTACLFVFTLACCSGDKDSGSSASDGSGTSSVSSSSSSSDNKGASTVNKASEEEDNQTFTLNSKTPENVVNAIFYAARTQDFQILGELCDPEGEGDGDTKSLCALGWEKKSGSAGNKITRENFVEVFKNGKISGVTTKREGGGASVPILFGPDGDKEETMNKFNWGNLIAYLYIISVILSVLLWIFRFSS